MESKTLGMYLGANVKVLNDKRDGVLMGIFISRKITWGVGGKTIIETPLAIVEHDDQINNFELHDVVPLLRPLSSMTESEADDLGFRVVPPVKLLINRVWNSKEFKYLLSKNFDLFGLIEKGEAIDSTTPNV